ncbi:MAG TPA: monofunctional biosynthetic peptidoglycan transglycosylase [Hyphomicrobiaceae bacterium]|nr:monofunctional biosynthetic peptidoglycan transglycosylase [Hyphomicrobiaceae bacterium]
MNGGQVDEGVQPGPVPPAQSDAPAKAVSARSSRSFAALSGWPLNDALARLTPAIPPAWWSSACAARRRVGPLLSNPGQWAGLARPYLRPALLGAAWLAAALGLIVLTLAVLYRWVNPPLSTLMLGQSVAGTEIERRWVPLERISPNLMRAVVVSEDGTFCSHNGVDWHAIRDAVEDGRGGSTITMQVVKNLFLWPSRSYVRKAIEIGLAYLVDALWPKRRILEIYLNIAEWGDGVFGAEAAARTHFGKSASRLTAGEAALMAVALPSPIERAPGVPGAGTDRLAQRLLARMAASGGALSCVGMPRRHEARPPHRRDARPAAHRPAPKPQGPAQEEPTQKEKWEYLFPEG